MTKKINNFQEQLDRSHSDVVQEFWWSIYQEQFPNMVTWMDIQKDCKAQRMGIDRVIMLSNGKTINIDEKTREDKYNDILIEYISNDKTNSLGWIEKDLNIDYLAYGWLSAQQAFIFDWSTLKRVWRYYKKVWIKKYKRVEAINNGYKTINVAVPINEVQRRYIGAISVGIKTGKVFSMKRKKIKDLDLNPMTNQELSKIKAANKTKPSLDDKSWVSNGW